MPISCIRIIWTKIELFTSSPSYKSSEHNASRELRDMSSSSQLTGRRRGSGGGCGARVAPALLLHVNLVLALYGGAGLATAARLKWDPTLYIAVRSLLPKEYRLLAVGLLLGGGLLILLAHLAALAASLGRNTARRVLYVIFAVSMGLLWAGCVSACWWGSLRAVEWLQTSEGQVLKEVMQLRKQLKPFLKYIPGGVNELIEEAEADVPCNGYVILAALALLMLLQPIAVVLAVFAAVHAKPRRYVEDRSESISKDESAPLKLKAVYRNGKLILV